MRNNRKKKMLTYKLHLDGRIGRVKYMKASNFTDCFWQILHMIVDLNCPFSKDFSSLNFETTNRYIEQKNYTWNRSTIIELFIEE